MSEFITIKENRDFIRLYKRGKSFVSPVLVTYVMKNKSGEVRYGITTGKKIGKAVKRTRARRVIRESFYELYPCIKSGYDIVFVARGKTPFVKSQTVKMAMQKHFEMAGIVLKR
ncbi:MAG: ribonuclease P protein component [Ruminococcus sp.]|nr:ribonuclease P protein component [Ruminococcus sp.]